MRHRTSRLISHLAGKVSVKYSLRGYLPKQKLLERNPTMSRLRIFRASRENFRKPGTYLFIRNHLLIQSNHTRLLSLCLHHRLRLRLCVCYEFRKSPTLHPKCIKHNQRTSTSHGPPVHLLIAVLTRYHLMGTSSFPMSISGWPSKMSA